MQTILFLLLIFISASCVNPVVKFRKMQLLDPMMDPSKTAGLSEGRMYSPINEQEKGNASIGSGSSSSCPTCGG